VFVDGGGEAMRRYGAVAALPKAAVVDRQGILAYVQPGIDVAALSAVLERLTAPPR
jgi:hypothetical protein